MPVEPARVERPVEAPGSRAPAPNGVRALAAIDKKIIPKPSTYGGVVKDYVAWNDGFKDFLETQDDRWKSLLNEIEKFGSEPITEEKQAQLEGMEGLGIQGQVKEFPKQLYTYIKAYTKGSAETLLLNNGLDKSFETWRSLADKGRSTRAENVLQLRLRVLTPSRVSKYSELEAAISAWDKERSYFEQLRPK